MRAGRLAGLALLALLALASAGALSGAARAETGAPALDPDGVWRARGDWTVDAGEAVVNEARAIEAFGNVSISPGASLDFRNVSLRLVGAGLGGAGHVLTVNAGARLGLSNSTLLAEGALDQIEAFHALIEADACVLRFRHNASFGAAVDGFASQINLSGCLVETDADLAVRVRNGAGLSTADCDFLRADGEPADIFVGSPSSGRLDTTRFGALRTLGSPFVVGFATVRFFLTDRSGLPQAGRVNGTGPWGELFNVLTAPNETAAVRLKWFEYPAAPPELSPEARAQGALLTFTAAAAGVGANNSAARLDAHRVNLTVVLWGSIDLSVESFTVYGKSFDGPALRRAYYVELNGTQALLVRVANRGVGRSPPVRFNLTQTALATDSWAPRDSHFEGTLEVGALAPGESANFSLAFLPGPFGGFKDDSGPCFTSVSYTSGLTLSLVDNLSEDFAPWNNARSFTLVAFRVEGDPAGACTKPGTETLPYLVVAGAAAVATVAFITHRYSDHAVAKRAARAPPQRGGSGPKDGRPPLP